MKRLVTAGLLVGALFLFAQDSHARSPKWALQNAAVVNFELNSPRKVDAVMAPAMLWLDLGEKSNSIAIALCGPEIFIESGTANSLTGVGLLNVQTMQRLSWFGSVFRVTSGKVILRVGTDAEKNILERDLKTLRTQYSCNYL